MFRYDLLEEGLKTEFYCDLKKGFPAYSIFITNLSDYWLQHMQIDAVAESIAVLSIEKKIPMGEAEKTLKLVHRFEERYDTYFVYELFKAEKGQEKVVFELDAFKQDLNILKRLLDGEEIKDKEPGYLDFGRALCSYFLTEGKKYEGIASELETLQSNIARSIRKMNASTSEGGQS